MNAKSEDDRAALFDAARAGRIVVRGPSAILAAAQAAMDFAGRQRDWPRSPPGSTAPPDLLRLYAASELEREESADDQADTRTRRDAWLLDTTILAGRFFEPGYDPAPAGATVPALINSQATAGDWLRAETVEHALRANELAERTADPGLTGWSNYYVSWALNEAGRNDEALPYARVAAVRMEQAGDRAGLPNAMIMQAMVLRATHRDGEAAELLRGAVTLLTDPATAPPEHIALFTEVTARAFLADISIAEGDLVTALEDVNASMAITNRMEYSPTREMVTLSRRALIYAESRRPNEACADLDVLAMLQEQAGGSTFTTPGASRDSMQRAERLLAAQGSVPSEQGEAG
ncbi:hypothetical protein ACQPWW_03590 [Micromonospora sp. CA-240977]|uniref:hypothetical protein n=1 Tax=Micromonospora sp. CA-240977 TaxID=3239957 RepID=UPI003D91201B